MNTTERIGHLKHEPKYVVSQLMQEDFLHMKSKILKLLSQLSDIGVVQQTFGSTTASDIAYKQNVENLFAKSGKTIVLIVESIAKGNKSDKKQLCAIGTVYFEPKITHDGCVVAHIEDVVVDSAHRGHGVGKLLIRSLCKTAESETNCYKVSLNCSKSNVGFYERCNVGLVENNEVRMIKYFTK